MNWRSLDLNLLHVFDAVLQERSVTRAAAKLNLTQPALSHALNRLRRALSDELFVRTPDGMGPTPYAENLAGPVRAALESLQTALVGAPVFDPKSSEHNFAIALDNRAAVILAAPLALAVLSEAPRITLDLRPSGTLDLASRLDRCELDLAITQPTATGDRFSSMPLFDDAFAVLVRRGHPAGSGETVSFADLGKFPHLVLSSTGEDTDFVDEQLAKQGITRRVALRAPLLSAAAVLAETDMIAIISERAAQAFAKAAPLQVLRLPFETPALATSLLWHRRLQDVPAHGWLRAMIVRVSKAAEV